tara:strand:- start:3227 stop:3766 length:540 start_codon:yes stop_codon:yes gene_type:complete
MFFRRIKREKKEKKSSSDDDESEFIMETIAVAGFAANQWEKHKQKKINDKMANSLALQNTQNALGIQGAAEAFEGSRMLRQGRLGQDVANLGASASSSMAQNLSALHDAKSTFAGSYSNNKALNFGKKSVWDAYNLKFDQIQRQDEDNRIMEMTEAYSSASQFKQSAQDLEAQIRGLKS